MGFEVAGEAREEGKHSWMCAEVGHVGAHPGPTPEVEEHSLLLEVSFLLLGGTGSSSRRSRNSPSGSPIMLRSFAPFYELLQDGFYPDACLR